MRLSCRFRAITSSYYRGALGAVLVYDITRRATFASLEKWLRELRQLGDPTMVVVLVGNKSDLSPAREVNEDEGRSLAEREGLCFMETSALDNMNVEEAFVAMITQIHEIVKVKNLESKSVDQEGCTVPVSGQTLIFIDEVSATKRVSCCSS